MFSTTMSSERAEEIRKQLSKVAKHLQCSICLNLMSNGMVTQCLHRFCYECIVRSIQSSSGDYCRCPLCNEKITKRSLREQTDLNQLIDCFRRAVRQFESDTHLSVMKSDEVVVFDASIDRNASQNKTVEISGDLSSDVQVIEETQSPIIRENLKISDNTNEMSRETASDVETNRQNSLPNTTINQSSWPSCESSCNNTKDISGHELRDAVDKSGKKSMVSDKETDEEIDTACHKSVAFKSRSRVTSGVPKKSGDDKVDKLVSKSNQNNANSKKIVESNNKSKSLNREKVITHANKRLNPLSVEEVKDIAANSNAKVLVSPIKAISVEQSKSKFSKLTAIGDKKRKDKKLKRVQALDSSDDENSFIINRKKKLSPIKDSEEFPDEIQETQTFPSDDKITHDLSDVEVINETQSPINKKKVRLTDTIELSRETASDVETNRQNSLPTTTITEVPIMSSWPTCESSSNNIEDISGTEKCDAVDKSGTECIDSDSESDEEVVIDKASHKSVSLKSQDWILNRSRVTYGGSKKSGDDKFDKLISKSNRNMANSKKIVESNNKSKSLNREKDITYGNKILNPLSVEEFNGCGDEAAISYAEALVAPIKAISVEQNKSKFSKLTAIGDKKRKENKSKRVQEMDSSDDENSFIINRKKKLAPIKDSEEFPDEIKETQTLSSDDELMTSIHSKLTDSVNNSLKANGSDFSVQIENDSRDSFNSETQLITSSPLSFNSVDSI